MGALLIQILSTIGEILGITSALRSLLTDPNGPNSLISIGTELRQTQDSVDNPVSGLPGIFGGITEIENTIAANQILLLAAIAAGPTSSGPVTLPTIPPAGYGGASSSDVFNAVWNTGQAIGGQTAWPWLQAAGKWAFFRQQYADVVQADDNFFYYFTGTDDFGTAASFFPVWSTSSILPGDTLLSYLTRINPGAISVFQPFLGSGVRIRGNTGDGVTEFLTTWTEPTFQQLKRYLGLVNTPVAAPVWPGLAKVTTGSPVALVAGLEITTPMHGVIVTLSATPPDKPRYTIGSTVAVAHIGQVAFVDDNGQAEYPQNLSFPSEVYVPQSMALAAGVRFRIVPGVVGSALPWLITP